MLIKITIDRFEEDKAVLVTEDGQSIIWPKSKLPDSAREGSKLVLAISNNMGDDASRELAKNILNEILNAN